MKKLFCIILILTFAVSASAELTDADLDKIKNIVASEVATYNRSSDVVIIVAFVSLGFFLLFAGILFVNTFLRHQTVNKQIILALMLSLGCSLFYVTQVSAQRIASFEHIVCKSLEVVDNFGNRAILLNSNKNLNAVAVYDTTGDLAVGMSSILEAKSIGEKKHDNSVKIYNKGENPKISLESSEIDSKVNLHDEKGISAISLISKKEANILQINNKAGDQAVGLAYSEKGNGIFVSDEKGQLAVHISSLPSHNGMAILNKQGKNAINMLSDKEGNILSLLDIHEKEAISLLSKDGYVNDLRIYDPQADDIAIHLASACANDCSEFYSNGIALYDKKQKIAINMYTNERSNQISLRNRMFPNRPRAISLFSGTTGNSLTLYDTAGHYQWSEVAD